MAKPAQGAKYRGSIHDFPGFDPSQDAEALYTAMKGFGSDKEAILELITSRSNRQRQEICQSYKSLYGKDLLADLKYELTGKFERLIVGLMRPLSYCDAKEIKDAISVRSVDLCVCWEWGCDEWEDSGLCSKYSPSPAPASKVP